MFLTIVCDAVTNAIIYQTNLYHQQNHNDENDWDNILFAEMKAFFGIYVMGLVELAKFHDYSSRNSISSVPWFSDIMPYKGLFKILAYLRLSNNTAQPTRDK